MYFIIYDVVCQSEEQEDKEFNKALHQLDKPKHASAGSGRTPTKDVKSGAPGRESAKNGSKQTPEKTVSKFSKVLPSDKVASKKRSKDDTECQTESLKSPTKNSTKTPTKGSTKTPTKSSAETPSKSSPETSTKTVSKSSKDEPSTKSKKKNDSKYKALPLIENGKRTDVAAEEDTPKTKARRLQEETPDSSFTATKPATPKKSRKVSSFVINKIVDIALVFFDW